MAENQGIRRLMNKRNFNKDQYLRSVINTGESEMSRQVIMLTSFLDETSSEMKKVIYENIELIIYSSKTVTNLESIMHLVNYDLTQQKRLLNEMLELRVIPDNKSDKSNDKLDDTNDEFKHLIETIDGVASLMKPDRYLLYADDVTELESDNTLVTRTVKLILMTDLLLVAKKYLQRNNEMGYRLLSSYDLSNVSLVNVTAGLTSISSSSSSSSNSSSANVFKVNVFPETKIFKADSAKSKMIWIERIEKQLIERQKARPLSIIIKDDLGHNGDDKDDTDMNHVRRSHHDSNDVENMLQSQTLISSVLPDWLLEIPDDLDVAIAERDLTTAVQLVERARQYSTDKHNQFINLPMFQEILSKVDLRATQLTEALSDELTASSGRRGGSRSVRVAVGLLDRLGRRRLACELLLRQRSSLLERRISQVAREGSQSAFVGRLSLAWHRALLEAVVEVHVVLGRHKTDFKTRLFCWCQEEAGNFSEQLRILLIESRAVPFLSLCKSIERVRLHTQATQRHELVGVQLESIMESRLLDSWVQAITEHTRLLHDACELRAIDDLWIPLHLNGPKDRDILIREMKEVHVDILPYIDGFTVSLTSSICQFSRAIILFATGLQQLGCHQIVVMSQDQVASLLQLQFNAFNSILSTNAILQTPLSSNQRNFVLDNLLFIKSIVLTKIEQCFNLLSGPLVIGSQLHASIKSFERLVQEAAFVNL